MSEITIHTGTQYDETRINVDWFNENNVPQTTVLDICIQKQDKPRTLEIHINGVRVEIIESRLL